MNTAANVYFYAFTNPGHPAFIRNPKSKLVQPYMKLINRRYAELFTSDDSFPFAFIDGTMVNLSIKD